MYNLFKKILPALKRVFFGVPVVAAPSSDVQNKTYIKFNLFNENLGTVINAELHLVVALNTGGTTHTVEVYGLNNNHAGEIWNENTITFDNGPANQAANAIDLASATLLGSFTVTSGDSAGTLKIFSSAGMVTWLNLDSNDLVTFILRRTDSNYSSNLAFASRESTSYAGPKLVINVDSANMYIKGKETPTNELAKLYTHGF